MKQIRFDDIEGLNATASDEFGDWGPPAKVTQEMVDAFADLTGDHQWTARSAAPSPTASSP